jgi:hypothetical protein
MLSYTTFVAEEVPVATSAGGQEDKGIDSAAAAFGFFASSMAETADAKGADC